MKLSELRILKMKQKNKKSINISQNEKISDSSNYERFPISQSVGEISQFSEDLFFPDIPISKSLGNVLQISERVTIKEFGILLLSNKEGKVDSEDNKKNNRSL